MNRNSIYTVAAFLLISLGGQNLLAGNNNSSRTTGNQYQGEKPKLLLASRKSRRAASRNAVLRFHHFLNPRNLFVRSRSAVVVDLQNGKVLYGKRIRKSRPIASLTKVLTAMVILDARQPLNKRIRIRSEDVDRLKYSRSRLRVGTVIRRKDALFLALAASENRAAHALARTYPGGKRAFVRAMNRKARQLGMKDSRFVDASGLSSLNLSSAHDLVRLLSAAYDYPTIQRMTTSARGWALNYRNGRLIRFRNTNRLVRRSKWIINVSKTGFINESGYCIMMHASIANRPIAIVLLGSVGKYSKFGDAGRIRKWIQRANTRMRRYRKIVRQSSNEPGTMLESGLSFNSR